MEDTEFLSWWRTWSSISEDDLSDDVFYILLATVKDLNPDATDCNIKYWLAYNAYKQLIRKYYASTGGSGSEISRKETRGKTRIEVEYSEDSDAVTTWESALDLLIEDPQSIGCRPFEDTDSTVSMAMINGSGKTPWDFATPWKRQRNKFNRCKE